MLLINWINSLNRIPITLDNNESVKETVELAKLFSVMRKH